MPRPAQQKHFSRQNRVFGLGLARRGFAPVQINRSTSNRECVVQLPTTSIAFAMRKSIHKKERQND
jgi:hypothetical protein